MSELEIEKWLESGPIKRETLEVWLSILKESDK